MWRCETYLVSQSLAGNDGDFIAESLVGFEVESELWVVALDDDFGGLLDGLFNLHTISLSVLQVGLLQQRSRREDNAHLGTNATHLDGS